MNPCQDGPTQPSQHREFLPNRCVGQTLTLYASYCGRIERGNTAGFYRSFPGTGPLFKSIAERYRTDAADKKTTPIDYAAELQYLRTRGVGGLNNGLSADENEILFTSKNLPEIIYLVLKGLTQRL